MKIAIVHDAPNEEENMMIKGVENALSLKYDTEKITFDENFLKKIKDFDFVFNLSTYGGETRQVYIPALLDKLRIPYTSSNAYTHSICMDKQITKLVLNFHKIPTPKFFEPENYKEGERFIIKPSREGSAKGITKESVVSGIENIKQKINEIEKEFKQKAVAEEFIEGRELSVGIIGNGDDLKILPILEIDFSKLPKGMEKFYSFRVKHKFENQTIYKCPADIDQTVKDEIRRYAKKIFKVLKLRDYARMDIRLKGSMPYFIEVNSMPQLVNGYSDITKMAKAKGYDYDEFIVEIVKTAFKRYGITPK